MLQTQVQQQCLDLCSCHVWVFIKCLVITVFKSKNKFSVHIMYVLVRKSKDISTISNFMVYQNFLIEVVCLNELYNVKQLYLLIISELHAE